VKLSLEEPQVQAPAKAAKIETPATLSANAGLATFAPLKINLEETVGPASQLKTAKETTTAPAIKSKPDQAPKSTPPTPTVGASSSPKPPVISESPKDVRTISFSLKAVLRNLPTFQLRGDAGDVSADARIAFPLPLIEPQLAGGRVSIAPEVFEAALPAEHRDLFQVDVARTPVALPLEEVLKNLPATVLKLRDDQEHVTLDRDFETPFLAKAQEDALRFAATDESTEETGESMKQQAKLVEATPAIEKVDPKNVVLQANRLAGVKACAITFSDGLSLAGDLPGKFEADGLCAMAPSLLQRLGQHLKATKLGQLVAMTLYANDAAISFFARGNVCLTAIHDSSLAPDIRARLAELTEKLSHTYTQSESPNVDH
jgi:predicted regulator of Ras-like GTPase activity (Roadblock/LC7/MglB family)